MFRITFFALLFGAVSRVYAQEALSDALHALTETTPDQAPAESAWLDLRRNAPQNSRPQEAPPWVEAVTFSATQPADDTSTKSVFRIRVTRPSPDYQVLFFRLFFDDKPGQQPELIAWDESGAHVVRSGALGLGIDLPSSDSVMIPMTGASSIDIEVPGDGKTVRGAYLDWMASSAVVHPLNADRREIIPEPFLSRRRAFWNCHCHAHRRNNPNRHGHSRKRGLSIWDRSPAPRSAAHFRGRQSAYRCSTRDLSQWPGRWASFPGITGIGGSRLSRPDGAAAQTNVFSIYRLAACTKDCPNHKPERWNQ